MLSRIRLNRILVPLAPDETAQGSVGYAAELARRFDGEVVLMVANEILGAVPRSEHARRAREDTVRLLQPELDRLARAGVPARVLPYPIRPPADEADAIVAAAAEESVDLIVLETHGRHGWARLAHLGSVSERVVRDAPCPVLVLRRPRTPVRSS